MPLRAAASAVTCAANGVDLREPLKPAPPADSHAMTLPSRSVSVTIVLLKLDLMCATPTGMFLRTRRRPPRRAGRCSAIKRLLPDLLLARSSHSLRALTRARIGLRARPTHRKAAPVAQAAVAADLHQALDVLRALTAEIALDGQVAVDDLADAQHLVVGQVADVGVTTDPGVLEDLARQRRADAVDVGQPDLDALVERDVYSRNTSHYACVTPASACVAGSGR